MCVFGPVVILFVMAVAVQDTDAPVVLGVLFGVPLPRMLMPIPDDTTIPEVHVQEPDGI
jgi:hypothetical protein